MLIPLLLLAIPAHPATAAASTDPPVRVSFNDDGKYMYGDKARVYVQSAQDGYVVVLRSDARGNVRVLSPVDPDDDQQIYGGKKYEVKGRGGREAFVVEDTSGQGVVLAAWSKTPFDVTRFERNAHWNTQALGDTGGGLSRAADDPETRLLGLMDAMRPGGHYEYDAATYVVYAPRFAAPCTATRTRTRGTGAGGGSIPGGAAPRSARGWCSDRGASDFAATGSR
jgi:hypothetical protein